MMKRNRDSHLLRKTMRTRFKKLVRHVLLNLQFLDETEDQGISMNVKKNVAFLVRQKRKTGVLTIAEKALLRAKHSTRTIEERKRLCMIIATQPCFSRLPPKIRARLVSVLHFMTINTDRVIVKEGDVPIHVYFIVSGEVEMIKSSYDKITKKVSKVTEAIVGSGDWIGDVEILEDCTRINTYVTMTTCELLAISTSDFLGILGGFVKKQWLEKKAALKSLSYFDFLTEDQIIRACKNGYLMQYDPLQSIYSEETTGINYVHFILSGECVILQCLKMKVIKNEGQTTFELLNVSNNPQSLFQASSKSLKSQRIDMQGRYNILTDSVFNLQELLATSSEADREEALERKKAMRKMGLREIEIACGLLNSKQKPKTYHKSLQKSQSTIRRTIPISKRSVIVYETEGFEEDYYEHYFDYITEEFMLEEADKSSGSFEEVRPLSIHSRKTSVRIESFDSLYDKESSVDSEISVIPSSHGGSRRNFSVPTEVLPLETHFIDVGSLTYGGIFGLGEKMMHRVIMARTVVQCLLLPRYWLMEEEQNPGHIWQRRRFYLETSIPSREELFGNFLKTRRWEEFKHDYVQSTLNPNSVNDTQLEDIPIISRIVETTDEAKK